jgi:hypothetical protein
LLIGGNAASSWRALAKSNASVSRRRHDHGLAGSDFAADLPAGQRFFVKGETFVGLLVSCSAGLTCIAVLPWTDRLPSPCKSRDDGIEATSFHGAMTRAQQALVIANSRSSAAVEELHASGNAPSIAPRRVRSRTQQRRRHSTIVSAPRNWHLAPANVDAAGTVKNRAFR